MMTAACSFWADERKATCPEHPNAPAATLAVLSSARRESTVRIIGKNGHRMPFVAVLQPVDMIATGERLGSSSSSGILYASSV